MRMYIRKEPAEAKIYQTGPHFLQEKGLYMRAGVIYTCAQVYMTPAGVIDN